MFKTKAWNDSSPSSKTCLTVDWSHRLGPRDWVGACLSGWWVGLSASLSLLKATNPNSAEEELSFQLPSVPIALQRVFISLRFICVCMSLVRRFVAGWFCALHLRLSLLIPPILCIFSCLLTLQSAEKTNWIKTPRLYHCGALHWGFLSRSI